MANTKSQWANGNKPMIAPIGSEVVNVLMDVAVLAANTAANDLIILGSLPDDCVLVDAVFAVDDLDSNGTPAIALSFGTVNAAETDLDATIQAGLTIGQGGGAVRMTPTIAALGIQGGETGIQIGFKVTTAAATGQNGTARVSLSYRSEAHGS